MSTYAGIGARKTPAAVLSWMYNFALDNKDKFYCRTGATQGADQAFMKGAKEKSIVYLPWKGYEKPAVVDFGSRIGCDKPTEKAIVLASTVHPNWDACSTGAKLLHGRNAHIIFGRDLHSPVQFVLAWFIEVNGEPQGGTGLAIRLARKYGIPVKNLNTGVI